ncbi:hypothetical protein [Halopelagius longus]|uniref:DUF7979 domain-containing protein n=1 Tax=Halopelagius longus TaxID=1236180 RepID=A0A1H0XQD5_9EURY|nr:hypothetical protein [Halopelagius longus]RDI72016.1 hypothetical protein DWB78_09945 [Halopelagius longus]SDQ05075.1 hypothetical protein SAMN05216278_0094 [Halopelagius longus]
MHPRTPLLVSIAVLVVLAGCSAAPGSPAPGSPAPDGQAETDATAAVETETATDGAIARYSTNKAETNDAEATTPTKVTNGTKAAAASSSTHDCPPVLYLEAVERPSDETVVAYGNLSAERKAEFDTALVEGNAEIEGGDGYEFWVDRPYVEHDGNVYRAVVAVC